MTRPTDAIRARLAAAGAEEDGGFPWEARFMHVVDAIGQPVADIEDSTAITDFIAHAPDDIAHLLRVADAARFVATYWRDEYIAAHKEAIAKAEVSYWPIGTHPLAMVLAALDGETKASELGIPESRADALRAALEGEVAG